jgi:hypothetical protein
MEEKLIANPLFTSLKNKKNKKEVKSYVAIAIIGSATINGSVNNHICCTIS